MSRGSLVRVRQGRILGGVCTGLARYLDFDLTWVRVIVAALVIFTGVGPFLYLLAWLAMPAEGADHSGLDSLVDHAKDWNAKRTVDQAPQEPHIQQEPGETFDLYRDGH